MFGGSAGARAAFVATTFLPGVPLLQDGEEVESPQKLTLFEKEPVTWNRTDADKTRAFYFNVINLERTHPAFSGSTLIPVKTNAPNDVIAYRRDNVLILVNARHSPVTVESKEIAVKGARDLITGATQLDKAVNSAATASPFSNSNADCRRPRRYFLAFRGSSAGFT